MATLGDVVPILEVLAEGQGKDGEYYKLIPVTWTLAKMEEVWGHMENHEILSDDVPHNLGGFSAWVLKNGAVWWEGIQESTGESMGLFYLTDIVPSMTEKRIISATWHAMVWDSNASARLPIVRLAIKNVFKIFKLHRLEAHIPVYFGGAIRVSRKIGFVPEDRARSARRIHDKWYDVLNLSILEEEVAQWEEQ